MPGRLAQPLGSVAAAAWRREDEGEVEQMAEVPLAVGGPEGRAVEPSLPRPPRLSAGAPALAPTCTVSSSPATNASLWRPQEGTG